MTDTNSCPEVKSHKIPCSGCGYGLEFAPDQRALNCPQCFAVNHIAVASDAERADALAELDLKSALEAQLKTLPRQQTQVVTCSSCGAAIHLPAHVAADRCPFCTMPMLVEQEQTQEMLLPSAILPFRLTEREAQQRFKQWCSGSLRMAPEVFRKNIQFLGGLKGIYMPFWTFDVPVHIDYIGKRGTKTNSLFSDEDGISWGEVGGRVEGLIDDILVPASKAFPQLMQNRELWPLEGLEPYREDYVSGFTYMLGQTNLSEGAEGLAKSRGDFNREVHSWIADDIGGDRQKTSSYTARFGKMTFKYILLPVWLASCKHEGKLYYFLINGYTGKITGEYPSSSAKAAGLFVGFWFLNALCLGSGIVFPTLGAIGLFVFPITSIILIFFFFGIKLDSFVIKPKLKFIKLEKHTSLEIVTPSGTPEKDTPSNKIIETGVLKYDSKLPFSLKIILAIILIIPFVLLFGPAGCVVGPVIVFFALLFAADR